MIDSLQLQVGCDIPFPSGGITIHIPTIKEIGMLGSETFFMGCQLIDVSKDMLEIKDKNVLEEVSNFDILLTLMMDKNPDFRIQRTSIFMVLALLFPQYTINLESKRIVLKAENTEGFIDNSNFEEFKEIILLAFCFKESSGKSDYNPAGDKAKAIIEKFKERERILAKQNKENKGEGTNIFARYISILSVGEHKDMNDLSNYTIYQLLDEFQRYTLKVSADINIQARMAGAKDLQDAEDWMKDIHLVEKDSLLSDIKK